MADRIATSRYLAALGRASLGLGVFSTLLVVWVASADVLLAGAYHTDSVLGPDVRVRAFWASLGLFVPPVVLTALLLRALVTALAALPTARRLRAAFPGWTTPAPRPVAVAGVSVVGAALAGVLGQVLFIELSEGLHSKTLASLVMGAAATAYALLWAAAAPDLAKVAARGAQAVSDRVPLLRALFTAVTFAVVGLAVIALAVWLNRRAWQPAAELFGSHPLAWGAVCALGLLIAQLLSTAVSRRASRGPTWLMWALGACFWGALLFAFSVTAASYGRSALVRQAVERESFVGRRLVRTYARYADRDRDGHAFAFGGRDCDDSDPTVYPGAPDPNGDGVDADCFNGDGSPDVAHASADHYRYGQVPAVAGKKLNILLVMVDALRPDMLGCFGSTDGLTPNIDTFCKSAVRVPNVVAQSSRSIRSIPAIMTGTYPSQVAYGPEHLYPTIKPENELAVERLKAKGYATHAIFATHYFDMVPQFFQGFDTVEQHPGYKARFNQTVPRAERAIRKLEAGGRPWFMWLYLFHTHVPYMPYKGVPSKFGDDAKGRYKTEVTLVDEQIGRLMKFLKEISADEDTVVVLVSDHGEALGEHGTMFHSSTVYEEQLRSTWIMKIPGAAPKTIEGRRPLFDLGPTLLDLAGTRFTHPTSARSLLGAMLGEKDDRKVLFSELMPDGQFPYDYKAIYAGNDKLIWHVRDGAVELYDLKKDPRELHERSGDDAATSERLLGLLSAWVAAHSRADNRNDASVEAARLAHAPKKMDLKLGYRYPGFDLLGFDVTKEKTVKRGQSIDVTLYAKAREAMDADYSWQFYFRRPGADIMRGRAMFNRYPIRGRYKTFQWQPGEVLEDHMPLVLPKEFPLGDAELRVRVLESESRVVVAPGHPAEISLGTFKVVR